MLLSNAIAESEFFREATIRICGSLDINIALERCYQYLKSFIPFDDIVVILYDQNLGVVEFIAHATRKNPGPDYAHALAMPKKSAGFFHDLMSSRDQILITKRSWPDTEKINEMLKIPFESSSVLMRLEVEGPHLVYLSFRSDMPNMFTPEHGHLIRMLHDPFAIATANAMRYQELVRLKSILDDRNSFSNQELSNLSVSGLIGANSGLANVMQMVRQVSRFDSPVMLLGETGVGKGMIAHAIHQLSTRRSGPFISVNCGALPDSLLDSELFGHEKGAFTGAVSQQRGRFERADRGTIFLDEIGELSPPAQIRLLNVLQSKMIERVGGTNFVPVDIRVISATHRNLEKMVASGSFREDLWHRLNVFPIWISPLRQRKEDIPALVNYYIKRKCTELKLKERPVMAKGTMEQCMAYHWPGNVRELANTVEKALIRFVGGSLIFDGLFKTGGPAAETPSVNDRLETLAEINSLHIRRALEMSDGKINGPGGAAEILGIHPNTLRRRMDKLGIPYKKEARKHASKADVLLKLA